MGLIIAVTGHRPNKLGGYDNMALLTEFAMDSFASNMSNIELVYTGMALGWDTAVAYACDQLNIPYIACVPFRGQEKMWPQPSQDTFNYLCSVAQEVVIVSEGKYQPWYMRKRNEYMVDKCSLLIAMWDGTSGGTANCIEYAEKKGIRMVNWFNPWRAFRSNNK